MSWELGIGTVPQTGPRVGDGDREGRREPYMETTSRVSVPLLGPTRGSTPGFIFGSSRRTVCALYRERGAQHDTRGRRLGSTAFDGV